MAATNGIGKEEIGKSENFIEFQHEIYTNHILIHYEIYILCQSSY
ncbi:unnamed protein product [Brugia timori]|uniref:Bm1221, isoform a n=2 Tax=Brugia TaxID=6278 RepID=A0A1I9G0W1_BRUMA|nr:Bm1221, isoform a [Brugia malayi]VDO35842.1 unnamed protein product [Brugia timori]